MTKNITKTIKVESNINEVLEKIKRLEDLMNEANSIIEELVQDDFLKIKFEI